MPGEPLGSPGMRHLGFSQCLMQTIKASPQIDHSLDLHISIATLSYSIGYSFNAVIILSRLIGSISFASKCLNADPPSIFQLCKTSLSSSHLNFPL